MTDIYNRMVSAGVSIDSHESDLYVPVCQVTCDILRTYEHRANVHVFKNQLDGKPWFDIPFGYLPFWQSREQKIGKP